MFDDGAVRPRLAGTRFPRLRYVRETDSTNDDASLLLGDAQAAGTLIVADYQRHGRGRRGRRWLAPPGSGLLFSAILPDAISASRLWIVPFWCGLCVADALDTVAAVKVQLQWPNDVLLGGRKVCGLLSTSRVVGEAAWVACGFGINVHRPSERAKADPHAAYLTDTALAATREDLLIAIVKEMHARLAALQETSEDVAREWESRAGVPGERYRIQIDGEATPFEGRAVRLDADGSLVVSVDGRERRVSMGDARVLRD